MKNLSVDVAVVGAGTAGLSAFAAAKAAGASAVLIEGGVFGTTCARVGCMPSKLLIAAADAAHAVSQAPRFGVQPTAGVQIDGKAVMARVSRERDRFVAHVLESVDKIAPADLVLGHARFANNHTLHVDQHTQVKAKSIVLATGAKADYPKEFLALGDRLVTSDSVFDWHDLPAAVAVIGPGVIGLELGQALHRLGVRVVVLGRGGRVGPISDPVLQAYAVKVFRKELVLEPDATIVSMQRHGDQVVICYAPDSGPPRTESFDFVLAATGRVANVGTLSLGTTTLVCDAKGVPEYALATTQTTSAGGNSPIFMAGDAGNRRPLLHEANDEGRIAGRNAARFAQGLPPEPGLRRAELSVAFSDPQIGIVGGGYKALAAGSFATGRASFEDQGRARILLRNVGLLHVYGDLATGRLLGAELLAPQGEHLAHLLAWAVQAGWTPQQLLQMPFYHPVLEEGLRTAVHDLVTQMKSPSR